MAWWPQWYSSACYTWACDTLICLTYLSGFLRYYLSIDVGRCIVSLTLYSSWSNNVKWLPAMIFPASGISSGVSIFCTTVVLRKVKITLEVSVCISSFMPTMPSAYICVNILECKTSLSWCLLLGSCLHWPRGGQGWPVISIVQWQIIIQWLEFSLLIPDFSCVT